MTHHTNTPGEHGFASVEFVLVLPVLMGILMGIVEYGWFFKTRMAYDNAVNAAAQAVALNQGYEQPDLIALSAISEVLGNTVAESLKNHLKIMPAADPPQVRVSLSKCPYTQLTGMMPDAAFPSTISATAVTVYP